MAPDGLLLLSLRFEAVRPGAAAPPHTAPGMDSDEGYNYEFDDEEECSDDSGEEEPEDETLELGEVELVDPVVAAGERDECGDTGGGGHGPGDDDEEDYRFEVLTAEQILQHMVECIREVNEVIQVRTEGGSRTRSPYVYQSPPRKKPGPLQEEA